MIRPALAGDVDGFNPSVGILGVQARSAEREHLHFGSFNPSVGILGVQAFLKSWRRGTNNDVSIPQSGFWVFKHVDSRGSEDFYDCFNPSVGILGVQAGNINALLMAQYSFNPSVGILGVQARAG